MTLAPSNALPQHNTFETMLVDPLSSLYHLIEPRTNAVIGPWALEFPAYSEVIGYSNLGHIFLRNLQASSYAVLHPLKAAAKAYGEFGSISEFEQLILRDAGFEEYVLRRKHVEAVAKLVGPLSKEEVYIPQPYPMLGGSDLPKTYGKGNVWVYVSILAGFIGR